MLTHLKAITNHLLDPLQFAYRANRSVDYAVNMGLYFILLKFADDTTLIGLISDGDEAAYRKEIDSLAFWCSQNHLELNALKTKEMVADLRRSPAPTVPFSCVTPQLTLWSISDSWGQ